MRKIQKISIVGGTVGVLMAGGVAYAAWTSTGTGTGTVTAGGAADLQVTVHDVSGLKPSEAVAVTIDVKNMNTYSVNLDSLVNNADHSSVSGGIGGSPACSLSDLSNIENLANLTEPIAGGATVQETVHVTMSAAAANSCQGADFALAYDASAHSIATN